MPSLNLTSTTLSDDVLQRLSQHGFVVMDNLLTPDHFLALQQECLALHPQFKAAAVQNGVQSSIRSDAIYWLEGNQPASAAYLACLEHIKSQLNQAFYFGIRSIEAHFACYESGCFYALHRDNPQHKNGRKISSVFYLHDSWQPSAAGELRLQDVQQQWQHVQPLPNRLVLFDSDLLHEVLLTHQQRLSITAWFRTDDSF